MFQYDKDGLDSKTCFYLYDTYGKNVCNKIKCNNPQEVERIIWGKQLMNLTIKMWVEDLNQGLLFWDEVLNSCQYYPEWVLQSVKNQLIKEIGWKPKFLGD